MKMCGIIGRREVSIFIDSRVTHNFISSHIVRESQLQVNKIISYNMVMGNSMESKGCSAYMGVELYLQGIKNY